MVIETYDWFSILCIPYLSSCVHQNHVFKRHCPFGMVDSLSRSTTPTNDGSSFNYLASVIDRDYCVYQNQIFKKHCQFSKVVSLTKCDTPSNDGSSFNNCSSLNDESTPSGSSSFNHLTRKVSSNKWDIDCSDDEPNNYLESQKSDDANVMYRKVHCPISITKHCTNPRAQIRNIIIFTNLDGLLILTNYN